MPGSGLLSMEDARLMKEFLGSEEVKNYVSDVGKGFIEGFADMGKDAVDLGKVAIKYGLEPSAVTMIRIAFAVKSFLEVNEGKEWEVIREGSIKVAEETWREIVKTATTGKGHGHILAEATAGVVIGRTLKVLKTAGKVVDEVIDFSKKESVVGVIEDGVCPREFGLVEKSDIKLYCPVGAGNAGKKVETCASTVLKKEVCSSEIELLEMAGEIKNWNPLTGPGPLGKEIASTFKGASYVENILAEDIILYRVYGGKANQLGSYWTKVEPKGPLQSRIDLGLLSEWENTASDVVKIKVPKGNIIYEGSAASQVGRLNPADNVLGGGSQVYVHKVNPKWIIE